MKQIQIENGVIRYYGNRVGRVTEGSRGISKKFSGRTGSTTGWQIVRKIWNRQRG